MFFYNIVNAYIISYHQELLKQNSANSLSCWKENSKFRENNVNDIEFNYISGEKSNNIFGSIEKSHGEPSNIKNQTRNTLVMAMNKKEERVSL